MATNGRNPRSPVRRNARDDAAPEDSSPRAAERSGGAIGDKGDGSEPSPDQNRALITACAPARARGSFQSRITPPRTPFSAWQVGDDPATWSGVSGRLHSAFTQRCEQGKLATVLWDSETRDARVVRGYCKSYRCRVCGSLVAKVIRDRIAAAVAKRAWWLYLVVTFDPKDFDHSWDAYKRAGVLWDDKLRKRMAREFGPFVYVQTWERHVRASAFPHMNLIVSGEGLRAAVEEAGTEWRFDPRAGHGTGAWCNFTHLRKWFARAVPQCGFGKRVWAQVLDDAPSMAAYLAKATEDMSAARWKDGDQTTIGAPRKFRRLRASRGLLPKVETDPFLEGLVVPCEPDAIPMVPDKDTGLLYVDPAWCDRIRLEQAEQRARAKEEEHEDRFETGSEGVSNSST
jgi:hypothetical protein